MEFSEIIRTLLELAEVNQRLSDEEFVCPIELLGNSTIGEHTRHIIELFQALINKYEEGTIDYDTRERNIAIQTNRVYALAHISLLIENIEKENKVLKLYSSLAPSTWIETNYFREILYNFEHTIHHQALIKVGLLALGKTNTKNTFGVAPSTIQYREKCAQ